MVVDREVEQAFADILVAEVATGLPRTLVVRGSPGSGKSLLVEHLSGTAGRAGFRVLACRAQSGVRTRPFEVVGRLLDGLAPDAAAEAAAERIRLIVRWLATERPVLLVLDDVQWADRSTIELVERLLHRPPEGPVLLVVALRPGDLPGVSGPAGASSIVELGCTLPGGASHGGEVSAR